MHVRMLLTYFFGAVIRSMIGGCPVTTSYSFTIPSSAPSGRALFAWTWFNKIGNREMYMNCAVVDIVGTSTSALSGLQIFKANIVTQGNCSTIEGTEVVFPRRGADVVYGGGYAGQIPGDDPRLKSCSYAGEYSDLGMVNPPSTSAGAGGSATLVSSSSALSSQTAVPTTTPATSDLDLTTTVTHVMPTDSPTVPNPPTSTLATSTTFLPPPAKRPSRNPSRSFTRGSTFSTRIVASRTAAALPTVVIGSCSLGSIRCEANGGSWSLCADNEYVFMGSVAPGTMCLSNEIVKRSDRGACSASGQILCEDGGGSWSMCSGGVWVKMGLVAAGTKCVAGDIIAV